MIPETVAPDDFGELNPPTNCEKQEARNGNPIPGVMLEME